MEELQLKIVSPEKILFEGKVYIVQLPGVEGTFSILSNHAPLVAALRKGNIVYQIKQGSESVSVDINGGFVEINKNIVTVCAE